jgi:hypothetical protein
LLWPSTFPLFGQHWGNAVADLRCCPVKRDDTVETDYSKENLWFFELEALTELG